MWKFSIDPQCHHCAFAPAPVPTVDVAIRSAFSPAPAFTFVPWLADVPAPTMWDPGIEIIPAVTLLTPLLLLTVPVIVYVVAASFSVTESRTMNPGPL